MDLRAQVAVVRRHIIMIIVAILIAGAAAGLVAHRRVPTYGATATIQLQSGTGAAAADATANAAQLAQFVTLPQNAEAATTLAREGFKPKGYQKHIPGLSLFEAAVKGDKTIPDDAGLLNEETSASGGNAVLFVSTTDANADHAAEIANAYALQYVLYSLDNEIQSNEATIDSLTPTIDSLKDQYTAAKGFTAKTLIQNQLNPLQTQQTTAEVALTNVKLQPNATPLVAASPSSKASGTPLIESILFGAIGGLLLGLGGAFLREQLDDRMRTRDDAADAADGLPILAEAPVDRRAIRRIRDDGIAAAMTTRLGESARALRTAIMFLGVHREVRRILVTSAVPGEGKTLTSALLATAYAQAGFRTILISADLRQPRLEQLLGIVPQQQRGLTEALLWSPRSNLRGGADARVREVDEYLAGQIDATSVPNLSVLGSGPLPPNPGELLSSQRMEDLLGHLAVTYDMLIIDSAPLIGLSDSRVLASMVDGLVLVTSIGQNQRSIRTARQTLQAADVHWLGLVVNRTPGVQNGPYHQQPIRASRRRRHAADDPPAIREVARYPTPGSFVPSSNDAVEELPDHETIHTDRTT